MEMQFKKASKKQVKLRIAIEGISGSGKTYTALVCAKALANGGKIAVIDTERGSASLYADKFDFDVMELMNFDVASYRRAIKMAEAAGYGVIVIDSLSHAWEGEGGLLEKHTAAAKKAQFNSFTAWGEITPEHRLFVDTMLQSPAHIVATMRSKTDYVIEDDGKGKKVPKKVGMAAIQRPGIEYEFTLVAEMDTEHNLSVGKTRIDFMDKRIRLKPDVDFFRPILDWCNEGENVETKAPVEPENQPLMQEQVVAGVNKNDENQSGDLVEETLDAARDLGAVVTEIKAEQKGISNLYIEQVDFILPNQPMEYTEAYMMRSESTGAVYGEIETPTLSAMYNQLSKSLKGEGLTDDERALKLKKQDAIKTLLAYRNAIGRGNG